MANQPRKHRVRRVGLLTLGALALAVSSCGSEEPAAAPTDVDVSAPAVDLEYTLADLRPEAVGLVDLADPRDAALVALWSNFFVKEASIVNQQEAWADDVAAEVATCLATKGVDPEPGRSLTEGARALISSRFQSTPSAEEEIPLPETPAWVRDWESNPETEICTSTIDARLGYLESGTYGERRQAAIKAGTWVEDDQLRDELDGLLSEHCPDAIANDDGACARLGEFLAAGAAGMRREISANWSVLRG